MTARMVSIGTVITLAGPAVAGTLLVSLAVERLQARFGAGTITMAALASTTVPAEESTAASPSASGPRRPSRPGGTSRCR